MLNIEKLIKALKSVDVLLSEDTDFVVGQAVLICHKKKDTGEIFHVRGVVTDILQHDEHGSYTRVAGENGKHYRAGLHVDEERHGTRIATILD